MKKKKLLILMAVTMVSMIALSACKSSTAGTTSEEASKSNKPINITMIQELFSAQPPTTTNTWYKKVQETTNTTLDVTFSPTSAYTDKINVLLASNKLPMVVAMNNSLTTSNGVVTGIQNGAFWNIDDYIKEYPNLKKFIGDDVWKSSKIQGKTYGIPRLRILPRNAMYYRKDWADKLGISAPKTLDDLYNMAKAFTNDDPDGNGKKDTWGLEFAYIGTNFVPWNGLQTICTALGGPNGWEYKDGKMTPDFITSQYMTTLDFFKKLYEQGYMNKDFAILSGSKRVDIFNQGNTGIMGSVIDDTNSVQDSLKKVVSTAKLGIVPVLEGSSPQRVNATPGYNGLIMFSKSGANCIKTEAELKQVLKFYDDMCSSGMQELMQYGIKGDQYKINASGQKELVASSDGNVKLSKDMGDITQLLPIPAYIEKDNDSAIQKEIHTQIKERTKLVVLNPITSLTSDTYVQYGSELDKIIVDADIKYIIGEIDVNGRNKEISTWRKQGGDKIIAEYAAEYNKYNK